MKMSDLDRIVQLAGLDLNEGLDVKDLQTAYNKVYDYVDTMGDSALEYLYTHAPTFDAAMDKYDGDFDAMAKNASQKELQAYVDELEAVRYELELNSY
jgi:hypothetical protein